MTAQIKTDSLTFGGFQKSGNTMVIHQDLERIEDIHQAKLSLVSLTRRMTAADSTRQAALIEILHALAALEKAADHIRAAHTN
jgi:hypothetical protein